MPTQLLKTMKAHDLPPEWEEELNASPDQEIEVSIKLVSQEHKMQEFDKITQLISQHAKAKGLTEGKLNEILNAD